MPEEPVPKTRVEPASAPDVMAGAATFGVLGVLVRTGVGVRVRVGASWTLTFASPPHPTTSSTNARVPSRAQCRGRKLRIITPPPLISTPRTAVATTPGVLTSN
jgi:hypothetical protein